MSSIADEGCRPGDGRVEGYDRGAVLSPIATRPKSTRSSTTVIGSTSRQTTRQAEGDLGLLRAGRTGYDLERLLVSMGVRCDVVALADPERFGDRVKTDRRDARRLAGLHRAGELTPLRPDSGSRRSP